NDGHITGVMAAAIDVTDQVVARMKVEEANKELQFAIDVMPQMVFVTKADGYHDLYNKQWYRYTGLTHEETEGAGWNSVLHPDDLERTWQVPANDPKGVIVSRLKGWSAYENKNYPQALTNMTEYFAKQKDESKLLAFDYLYFGKAQLKAGQDSLALINITKAVEKDSTNAEALSEVAKSLYDGKKYAKAAQVYEKAIKANPNGKGALYNYYYNALANYFDYGAKYSAKQNPSKDILVKADSSIAKVTQLAPETYDAYLTRARINSLMDDDKEPKGLMVPFYEEFISKVTAKPEVASSGTYPKRLSEAYDTLGGYYFYKDKTKAKEYFDKSVAVYPTGTFAAGKLKELSAPAPKAKGK
ncbi:MAG: tetratricopeptide repeat protein, partial [Pedobacter sp.]